MTCLCYELFIFVQFVVINHVKVSLGWALSYSIGIVSLIFPMVAIIQNMYKAKEK